jgi:hypothetical protein
VGPEILTGAFDRDDPYGKAMFGISAVFAELERDLIQPHQGRPRRCRARG